jgi:hypothetical protein
MSKLPAAAVIIILFSLTPLGLSGEADDLLLRDLAAGREGHEGKKITMTLKFKHVDYLFSKIYFYDRKNYDIVFDMSLQTTMDEFKTEILNLHEGLDYRVTFLFNGVGNIGLINGELISFTPVILDSIPEGKSP